MTKEDKQIRCRTCRRPVPWGTGSGDVPHTPHHFKLLYLGEQILCAFSTANAAKCLGRELLKQMEQEKPVCKLSSVVKAVAHSSYHSQTELRIIFFWTVFSKCATSICFKNNFFPTQKTGL